MSEKQETYYGKIYRLNKEREQKQNNIIKSFKRDLYQECLDLLLKIYDIMFLLGLFIFPPLIVLIIINPTEIFEVFVIIFVWVVLLFYFLGLDNYFFLEVKK